VQRARARGDVVECLARLPEAALDPRSQLAHGGGRRALGGALRQHDLDPRVGMDVDAHRARARRAANGVGDAGSLLAIAHGPAG